MKTFVVNNVPLYTQEEMGAHALSLNELHSRVFSRKALPASNYWEVWQLIVREAARQSVDLLMPASRVENAAAVWCNAMRSAGYVVEYEPKVKVRRG